MYFSLLTRIQIYLLLFWVAAHSHAALLPLASDSRFTAVERGKKLPEFSHQPLRFGSHTTATTETDKGGRSEADFYKDADRSNMPGQEY